MVHSAHTVLELFVLDSWSKVPIENTLFVLDALSFS
jgi:hypothetical protein